MKKTKKINWLVASIFLVIIIAIGGGLIYINSSKIPWKIEVSEDQQNIEIKKGQEFTINFTSNPSTGYSWSVDDMYNKNIISKISNEFIPSNSEMIGAPGKELWVFRGTNKGNTKLNFVYSRQRENITSQINSKSFNVTVK